MIAFDLETTGLLKPDLCELHYQPFITEIYLCKFDWKGNILQEFETYLKPPVPIPEEVIEITGITNEMVRSAPKFIEIYDELCDFVLGETTIFAHNCSFDIGVLACELQRKDLELRFPWPKNQICTVEASYPIQNKRMKLDDLHRMATGKGIENAHRAKNDVVAMVRIILWLKEQGFINASNY
jgi:DNA polymerase III epsilon subunit family exonuclease